jgi:hypothetical protein
MLIHASSCLLLQVAALVVYLLCEWFVSAYVFNFISIVTLLALDFWTVRTVFYGLSLLKRSCPSSFLTTLTAVSILNFDPRPLS